MDIHQESEKTKPTLAYRLKVFFDQLARRANLRITDLNDDCLLEIFSVKSLTLMDLCSLAETCTRFQQITQRVFPKDLSVEIYFNVYDVASRKYLRSGSRSSLYIQRIFKNFGSGLSEVSINLCDRASQTLMLNLVLDYSLDKLESLRVKRMEVTTVIAVKLKPIFKQLQILDLDGVYIEVGTTTLFADLDSLIELRVYEIDNDRAILENIFPKLERFTYYGGISRIYQLVYDHPLLTFISRHRSLKKLELKIWRGGADDAFRMNFLQLISNRCEDLEELDLDMGSTLASSLQPLQTLQSLKTIKLSGVECDDLKFIAALTNLRELHLTYCDLPEDSNQFNFLAQLTKLVIKTAHINGTFDVVDMIRRLTNLEELDGNYELDEGTFSEIVDV